LAIANTGSGSKLYPFVFIFLVFIFTLVFFTVVDIILAATTYLPLPFYLAMHMGFAGLTSMSLWQCATVRYVQCQVTCHMQAAEMHWEPRAIGMGWGSQLMHPLCAGYSKPPLIFSIQPSATTMQIQINYPSSSSVSGPFVHFKPSTLSLGS